MKSSRRQFLHQASLLGSVSVSGTYSLLKDHRVPQPQNEKIKYISIEPPNNQQYFKPLERLDLLISTIERGKIQVYDGQGNIYHADEIRGRLNFKVGGYLGYHTIEIYDQRNNLLEQVCFPVNCHTEINDTGEEFKDMLRMLHWSIFKTDSGMGKTVRFNNKYYKHYSGWFQDHVYAVSKGMKYFISDIEGGVDLYGDGQRDDGLIYDNYKHPNTEYQSYWEYRFDYGNFVYRPDDPLSSCLFVKVPVENIGQYTFIEGLYHTWKANDNKAWLKKHIDKAIKAVRFVTSSEYYWSEKFQMLRRPFTVDIWDFQPKEDAAIAGGDIMGVVAGKTRFGIHYGDNIAFSNACNLLGEMLIYLERNSEAKQMIQLGKEIKQRIDDLAWNGDFYHHHIPEDPEVDRNLGVDQSKQVSLSNALALNRALEHKKCVSIIKVYQQIHNTMPESSPGEWYTIYPPFGENEFGRPQWQYMNGGVTPIVAGELARGALEHGFESYGVSILRRINELAQMKENSLKGCYRGAMPDSPKRNFTPIDIRKWANTDKSAGDKGNVPGWIGSDKDDFINLPSGIVTNHDIPFNLIDPTANGNKACLILSGHSKYNPSVIIPVNGKHQSIYLLHTATSTPVAGSITILYDDNTFFHHYITRDRAKDSGDIAHWWYPTLNPVRGTIPSSVIWWRGSSKQIKDVGLTCFGLNNPNPNKMIKEILLENKNTEIRWAVFGITLCNHPVFFMPDIESTIPDHWASSHVVYGLIEGLVGVQDAGVSFNEAILVPRWEAAEIKDAEATIKYEASGGYVSYKYKFLENENKLIVEFTGNAEKTRVKILMPEAKNLAGVYCDREMCKYEITKVENSSYIQFDTEGIGIHIIEVRYT